MDFLTQSEVQFTHDDLICKESSGVKIGMALLFLSVSALMAAAGYARKIPWAIALLSALCLLFFAYSACAMARKTFLPSNWLLALNSNRVLIKFRSYLNTHFPEYEPHILMLQLSEIESVRALGLKMTTEQRSEGNLHTREKFLELTMREGIGLDRLRERLSRERQPVNGRKWNDFPVSLIDDRTIRVEWRSPHSRIVPALPTVIDLFRRDVEVATSQEVQVDLVRYREMPPEVADEHLRQMAERGDSLRAARTVMGLYRLSTTEAHEYVQKLLNDRKDQDDPFRRPPSIP